jgi:D-alanine-D-alanine ligase
MKNIAILTGGYSQELYISIRSGEMIYKNIDKTKYKVYKIIISKYKCVYVDNNKIEYQINKNNFTLKIKNKIILFDLIINIIHGSPGEDGQIKAYFDFIQIPCTGISFLNFANTFNKYICKQIIKTKNINTPKSLFLNKKDDISTHVIKRIKENIKFPCIIKPNKSGSSLGVSIIKNTTDIYQGMKKAFKEDDEIIIEEFIKGREFSVGIINYKKICQILPITEIISNNEFFDYNAKYKGQSKEITPANINIIINKQLQNISKIIYNQFNIQDMCRIEYILANNKIYFLEINTIPGLTENSILTQQINKTHISLKLIIRDIINNFFEK